MASIQAQFGYPAYVELEYSGPDENDEYDVFVEAREDSHIGAAWVNRDEFIALVEQVFDGRFVPNVRDA